MRAAFPPTYNWKKTKVIKIIDCIYLVLFLDTKSAKVKFSTRKTFLKSDFM